MEEISEVTASHRQLPKSIKQGTPSNDELEDLGEKIEGKWKKLGRRLLINNPKLQEIHEAHAQLSEKGFQMLLHWKQENGSAATYQALCDALKHKRVQRQDLAELFCYIHGTCDKGASSNNQDNSSSSGSSRKRKNLETYPERGQLPLRIDCEEISAMADLTGENRSLPTAEEVFNFIALKYFKAVDPCKPEELNAYLKYLIEIRKVLFVNAQQGSLIITVECSSLEILEELWEDYHSGHLNEMAQKHLITKKILKAFGLTEVKLRTTILQEEYTACQQYFLQSAGNLPFKIRSASAISRYSEEQDPQQAREKMKRYMAEKVDEAMRKFDLSSHEGLSRVNAYLLGHLEELKEPTGKFAIQLPADPVPEGKETGTIPVATADACEIGASSKDQEESSKVRSGLKRKRSQPNPERGKLSLKISCASAISRNSEEQDPRQARKKVKRYMKKKGVEAVGKFDLSSDTGLYDMYVYLVGVRQLMNVSFGKGSIKITVTCRTLEILERLWDDYCSGHLNAKAEECLITEKVKDELDMETITLETTILEDDYLACKLSLMEIPVGACPDDRQVELREDLETREHESEELEEPTDEASAGDGQVELRGDLESREHELEELEEPTASADVGQLELRRDLESREQELEELEEPTDEASAGDGQVELRGDLESREHELEELEEPTGSADDGQLERRGDLESREQELEQREEPTVEASVDVGQVELRGDLELRDEASANDGKVERRGDLESREHFLEELIEPTGSKTFLPRSNLPKMVPNFTGRENECDEVVGHMTSESTRIVSVWGSPGFGKTSIAIAVGHRLQARELPVYFLSLRGFKSKSDLTSKLLSLLRQSKIIETDKLQSLSTDDELGVIFDKVSDRCVIILDNADDLFECGVPNVKEEVINLIGDLLNRSDKINFLLTTRESLSFLNLHLQGHMAVRIKELDDLSCQALARQLLPEASSSDLTKVSQICGQVPLAIKLLCSSISEDFARCSQYLDEFMKCSDNIVEMLDDPDYPSNLRLKTLFDSSFQRLSTKDQESLVALCILPAQFDLKIAAAVLGITRTTEAEKVLRRLLRKSLIDCCSNSDKFSMHKLIQSFAREKGETDMKQTVLISKSRYYAFYIEQFEKLNENFLTGRSRSAFIEFYEHEKETVQSLIDGCLDSKTADRAFDVLTKAELFLHSLYCSEGATFYQIFDSALMAAKQLGKKVFYRRLLNSKAFGEVTWGESGITRKLLSESKELQVPTSSDCDEEKGKHLCYFGIYKLVIGNTEAGMKTLQDALSSMNTSPEHTILRLIIFQIFALYYQGKNDIVSSSKFYMKALKECEDANDPCLLVIPTTEATTKKGFKRITPTGQTNPLLNQPLVIEVIFLVSSAVKTFSNRATNQFFGNLVLSILKNSEVDFQTSNPGWFNFYRNVVCLLRTFSKYEANTITLTKERISFHEKALHQSMKRKENIIGSSEQHKEALAQNYLDLGVIEHNRGNYSEALASYKLALDIRRKLVGEEHPQTADSYREVGVTQHLLGDYTSALESKKHALDIKWKLFGEEHPQTADSYRDLGVTQHSLGDYTSALESEKHALDIRRKLFGEEHPQTADSYHSLGVTQHSLGDYTSAFESKKLALNIRRKLFGEEHPQTADSYHSVGVTQHLLGDYNSALESKKRALDIRRKLFGEDHSQIADSYHSVGVTQRSLGDYNSALESEKRALDIRRKLFGKEHPKTADSYRSKYSSLFSTEQQVETL
ncbi:uncharacterized protein LOC144641270 [Oculina patagonica]